ncbi:hypothetical protein Q7P37_002258 [Cladosporium fusiforme]
MAVQYSSPPQASVILVGQRGSGLSSFAVITAQLTGFKVVDVDARFVKEYSSSRAACLRAWGEQHYRHVANRFFRELLTCHCQGHVLVCASHAIDPGMRSLVREYSPDSPVVMVNRDLSAVRRRLSLADSEQSTRILHASQLLCRRASDVEFYNLPEEQAPRAVSELIFSALRSDQPPGPHVKQLQNVTQDVTRFLGLLGYHIGNIDDVSNMDPISSREFPSFTTLHLEDVVREPIPMSHLDCLSDALELSIPFTKFQGREQQATELISEAFQYLRRQHSLPIICHVEYEPPTGPDDKSHYLRLCRHGLRLLPEYATIDLQSSDQDIVAFVAASRRCTKIIAHRTFTAAETFSWKDPSLLEQCRRAAVLGCHHIRFVRFATSSSEDKDCASFQALANATADIMVSAVCIDQYAKSSAVGSLGLVPVRQPKFSSTGDQQLLPTLPELNSARFSSFVFHSLHFHVFGASVHYSMSPAMHTTAFELLGLQHSYSACESSSIDDLETLFDNTFGGASISLPFKSQAMCFLDSVSESARIIQAVNTILPIRNTAKDTVPCPHDSAFDCQKNKAGRITGFHGENTDWVALRTCIRRRLSAANSITLLSTALVIGAGGMARASVYALMSLGVRSIMIWNRTKSRAQQLADYFHGYIESEGTNPPSMRAKPLKCDFHVLESLADPWPADLKQPSVIVCTPPAHGIGNDPGLDFIVPQQWFRSPTGGVVVELSYLSNLSKSTSLLQQAYQANQKGWVVVEPLEILIEQGCAQFELFVGQTAPRKEMTRSVIKQYSES